MRLEGTTTINAPRDTVWRFLTDPVGMSQCVPGLESLEVLAPGERFRAVASAGFGTGVVTILKFSSVTQPVGRLASRTCILVVMVSSFCNCN